MQLLKHLREVVTMGQPECNVDFSPVLYFDLNPSSESSGDRVKLQKEYLDLALTSNGAIELYVHAYVWVKYLEKLAEISGKQDRIEFDPEFLRL